MGDIKTPSSAKGARSLKILRKTAQSVYASKLPPRSLRNVHHSHTLVTARHIKRIDRQPWEERVADILQVLEEQRFGKANALHHAMDRANRAVQEAMRKQADLETHSEELTAANEEMRAANEEMRATNEEMRATNEELRAVSEELERMHTDVELFAPLARDRIQNPLGRVNEQMKDFLKKATTQLDTDASAQLSEFSQTALAASMVMDSMLNYWQVELGGSSFENCDCEKILLQVLLKFQADIQAVNARLTHDAFPTAEVAKDQFELLMTCLIDNALRFNNKKEPEIHLSVCPVEEAQVDIPDPRIEKGWLFGVSDNGPGLKGSGLKGSGVKGSGSAKIFNIFETLGAENAGMGMGLAIAWRIVKRHGGNIWVRSTPQTGSQFYFTLPAYDVAE